MSNKDKLSEMQEQLNNADIPTPAADDTDLLEDSKVVGGLKKELSDDFNKEVDAAGLSGLQAEMLADRKDTKEEDTGTERDKFIEQSTKDPASKESPDTRDQPDVSQYVEQRPDKTDNNNGLSEVQTETTSQETSPREIAQVDSELATDNVRMQDVSSPGARDVDSDSNDPSMPSVGERDVTEVADVTSSVRSDDSEVTSSTQRDVEEVSDVPIDMSGSARSSASLTEDKESRDKLVSIADSLEEINDGIGTLNGDSELKTEADIRGEAGTAAEPEGGFFSSIANGARSMLSGLVDTVTGGSSNTDDLDKNTTGIIDKLDELNTSIQELDMAPSEPSDGVSIKLDESIRSPENSEVDSLRDTAIREPSTLDAADVSDSDEIIRMITDVENSLEELADTESDVSGTENMTPAEPSEGALVDGRRTPANRASAVSMLPDGSKSTGSLSPASETDSGSPASTTASKEIRAQPAADEPSNSISSAAEPSEGISTASSKSEAVSGMTPVPSTSVLGEVETRKITGTAELIINNLPVGTMDLALEEIL